MSILSTDFIITLIVLKVFIFWLQCTNTSPIETAENRGHPHDHVGNRQGIGSIFAGKLFEPDPTGPFI